MANGREQRGKVNVKPDTLQVPNFASYQSGRDAATGGHQGLLDIGPGGHE